jgi:hypothetical protein
MCNIEKFFQGSVLGNSGKHITLETSQSNGTLKVCFQEQGIRESRKSETCEVSNSRTCRVRGF